MKSKQSANGKPSVPEMKVGDTKEVIELTSHEEDVLRELFARQQQATMMHEQIQTRLTQSTAEVQTVTGRVMGAWETILKLRGINPAAWQVGFNAESGEITVLPLGR